METEYTNQHTMHFEGGGLNGERPYTKNVANLEKIPARVDRVHVEGVGRTKDDIIVNCFNDLFEAKNFDQVLIQCQQAQYRLTHLNCFKNVTILIDTSKGRRATSDGYEVTFLVNELGRIQGGIGTQVGNNEGSLMGTLKAPNLFGRGERLQFSGNYGSKHSSTYNLTFSKPFFGYRSPHFSIGMVQGYSEWPMSGYNLLDQNVLFDFGFNWPNRMIKHNFQWEPSIRRLSQFSTYSTEFDVRKQLGPTLKSAVRHILTYDTRDETIFPSSGTFVQIASEFSGLGGDIRYVKNTCFMETNCPLFHTDCVLQLCGRFGTILEQTTNNLRICDKFFAGGPLSMRGFRVRGMGPHSGGNATGGGQLVEVGAHLLMPLPFRPGRTSFGRMFRTQIFVNAGLLSETSTSDSTSDLSSVVLSHGPDYLSTHALLDRLRISYGFGVMMRLGQMARLELNYSFLYRHLRGDGIEPGVQFGIGVQFL